MQTELKTAIQHLVKSALIQGVDATQISIWVDEVLIDEVDYLPKGFKATAKESHESHD